MRSYFCAGKAGTVVKTDTHASGHAEDIDGARIWTEVMSWILGGYTALHGVAHRLWDGVLCQAKLLQRFAARKLHRRLDNVHSRYFLGDRVLHLL